MIVAGARSRQALTDAGDRPLVFEADGRTWSGAQLASETIALARYLSDAGLQQRRIGLWMGNSAAAVEAHLAVELVGGTRVPVDASAPAAEAQAVFDAATVDAIVVDSTHAAPMPDAHIHDSDAPLARRGDVDPIRIDPRATHILYPRMVAAEELLAVPMSYANWHAHMELNLNLLRTGWYGPPLGDDDVYVTVQQLMHGTGLVGSFPFLLAGLPQIILPTFGAEGFIQAALRHEATSSFFVPGMVSRVADALVDAPETDLRLRRLLYGGAPFPTEELRAAVRTLGPVLVQLYGRFEGGWPLTVLGVEEHAAIAAGDDRLARSCGRAVPGVDLEIRPAGGAGELRVMGPTVVEEYADPDGWCGLGDLGAVDADGYFYLEGRLDGMINTGSYHVYPAELEEAIAALPGINAVRVRGEPDPKWGQAVTAYVVADGQVDGDEIRRALRQRLARYKIPKTVLVVDALPPTEQDKASG